MTTVAARTRKSPSRARRSSWTRNPARVGVPRLRGCHSPSAVFLFTREGYELESSSSSAGTCSTSPARTVSSIDASRTKPECNRSSSRSDIESRATPPTRSSTRGRATNGEESRRRADLRLRARADHVRSLRQKGLALTARCAGACLYCGALTMDGKDAIAQSNPAALRSSRVWQFAEAIRRLAGAKAGVWLRRIREGGTTR